METVREVLDSNSLKTQKIPSILIIDDEQGPRESIKLVLSDDYKCFLAQNGAEGLGVLEKECIDLIILDLKMPGLSGIETLEFIRAKDPDVEVILLTGYGTLETAQKAIRLGVFDYMSKPFDIDHLREVVDHALERKFFNEVSRIEKDDLQSIIQRMRKEVENTNHLAHLGQISAGVVHQMKNPLTVILGYTQMLSKLLEDSVEYKLSEHSKKYLSIIETEAIRCNEIASKMLHYSKSKDGEFQQSLVRDVLKDIETLISPQCSINNINLIIEELPRDGLKVNIIHNDLHEVLLNLIFNSIQAMQDGGRLTIACSEFSRNNPLYDLTESEAAYLKNSSCNNFIAISVVDSGCGIPPQFVEKVFAPFFTTKTGESGTGLGLNICREKMQQNCGHVCVANTDSSGTTMRVILPSM